MRFKSEMGYPMSHYVSMEARLQAMNNDLRFDIEKISFRNNCLTKRNKAGLSLATWASICFENDFREEDKNNLKVAMKEFFKVMEETSE